MPSMIMRKRQQGFGFIGASLAVSQIGDKSNAARIPVVSTKLLASSRFDKNGLGSTWSHALDWLDYPASSVDSIRR